MNNKKVAKFLAERQPETPYLIVDLDVVGQAYKMLRRYMPLAKIFLKLASFGSSRSTVMMSDGFSVSASFLISSLVAWPILIQVRSAPGAAGSIEKPSPIFAT